MAAWRSRWQAVVASDVSSRDGIGWEFRRQGEGAIAWTVFRDDGGPFPVISASRGPGSLPAAEDLLAMTTDAVDDLLPARGPHDAPLKRSLCAGLLLAARDVTRWEGEEWALDFGPNDEPTSWAEPDDLRTPYAWLRAIGQTDAALITVTEDEGLFGLDFNAYHHRQLPNEDAGGRRSHRAAPLVTGQITHVEIVIDTQAGPTLGTGLLSEALLHGPSGSTLLVAAEAYSRDEWHLFDQSVVALPGLDAANTLAWAPARTPWKSTVLRS